MHWTADGLSSNSKWHSLLNDLRRESRGRRQLFLPFRRLDFCTYISNFVSLDPDWWHWVCCRFGGSRFLQRTPETIGAGRGSGNGLHRASDTRRDRDTVHGLNDGKGLRHLSQSAFHISAFVLRSLFSFAPKRSMGAERRRLIRG